MTLADARWRSATLFVGSVFMVGLGAVVVQLPDMSLFGRAAMVLLVVGGALMTWACTMLLLEPGTLTLTPEHLIRSRLWGTDIERHEALPNRAAMEGRRLRLVAASRL